MPLAAAGLREEQLLQPPSPSDASAMVALLASDKGLSVVQHTATRHPELRVLRLDEAKAHLVWVGTAGRLKYLRLRDVVKIEAAGDYDGIIASSSWAIWMRGSSLRASCYLSLRLRRANDSIERGRAAPDCADYLARAKRVQGSFDLEFSSGIQREVFIDVLEGLCEKAKAN